MAEMLLPKALLQWVRYRSVVHGCIDIEPFAKRLFEAGEYGWDYRYKH
jgi:hypothetical protein